MLIVLHLSFQIFIVLVFILFVTGMALMVIAIKRVILVIMDIVIINIIRGIVIDIIMDRQVIKMQVLSFYHHNLIQLEYLRELLKK